MNIETKHLVALLLLVAGGSVGLIVTLLWQKMRDVALFVFVFGAVLVEKMNVNFAGEYWYRGTSRGIEVSALDLIPLCLLFATLIVPRYRGRFFWPASFGMLLVYFFYCCGSVYYADPQAYGIWELVKVVRGLLVFLAAAMFIRTRRELAVVVMALGCVVCMEAFNGLEQRFFKGAFRARGTLDHENTLSTYLCTVSPVLLAAALANWSKWLRWFAGICCIVATGGELLTLSRMGVPTFAFVMIATAVMCTSWELSRQKVAIVGMALLCTAGLLAVSWAPLKARYTQSNIEAEFMDEHAVETRGVYWRTAFLMLEDHPYGVGLNNWSYYVSKIYGAELGYPYTDYDDIKWVPSKQDAHDTFLPPAADTLPALTLGELGIAGTAVFLLVWLRWFQMGATFLRQRLDDDPEHRLAIGFLFGAVGIFFQSATEWTYRQTAVMFTFHVLMGALAGLYRMRRLKIAAAKEAQESSPDFIDIDPVPLRSSRIAR